MQLLSLVFAWAIATLAAAKPDLAKVVAGILLKNYQDPFAPVLISQATISNDNVRPQQDLLNTIIGLTEGRITIRFNVPSNHLLRRPWVQHAWLIDSYRAFEYFYRHLDVDSYDFSGKYLVVHSGRPERDVILQIFEDLLKLQIVNVVFAGIFDGEVELWTYVPFAPGSCLALNLIMLPADVHLIQDFFPDKTSTFHGCSFKVGAFETRPYTFLKYLPSQEPVLSGFEGDLLETLKTQLNFKIILFSPPNNSQWGYAIKRNSTGLMKMIEEEEVDFGLSCLGISTARNEILKAGDPHYTTSLVISVPPGRSFSSLEKLFRPFQMAIWSGIIVVVAVGIVTIGIVQLKDTTVKSFIYGRRITTPYMNLIKVFLGIGLHIVPTRNFARTLLFLWIYFSFILRILYQGSSFKYLQLSLTRPPSYTFEDIDATDAHYHVINVGARYFEAFPQRMKRVRFLPDVKDSLAARLLWMSHHPDSPDVMMSGLDHVAYHNRLHRKRPGGFVHIAHETIAVFTVTIYYPKKSMLTKQFNRQIQWIQSAGLMNYWVRRYGDYDFFETGYQGSAGPKQLSVEHLLGVFELCAALLLLSFVVFLVELMSVKVRVLRTVISAAVR